MSRWWGGGTEPGPDDLHDPRTAMWIVAVNGSPFAFMQDYDVHGWDDHHFAALPPGSRGIDQFIGRADMLGRGHGPAFIRQRVDALFRDGVPVVATDPHPDNHRAIAAYRKAGFRVAGEPRGTAWGPVLPMHIRPSPSAGHR